MQSRNTNNLKGIDISHYQGNIDFTKVKAAGIDIVYIKATEGVTYIDPTLQQNYTNAKVAGLRVGFYHFFRASTKDNARQQAKFFTDTIKNMNIDCKHVIDLETTQNLDKEALSNLAGIFLEEVKNLVGQDVVLYTFTSFARNNINSSLGCYPLWIAHYGVNTPGDNPIWDSWIGFQYSSSSSIDGINGNVDIDEFTRDILIIKDDASVNNVPKQPVIQDKTSISYIQSALNQRYGFKLWVDNILGKQTLKGIYAALQIELNKQFNKGLVVDGVPGPITLGAMQTIKKGASGNITWLLQALLICKGLNLGVTGIDGDFGNQTLIAVQNFQSANGLATDGIVGINTWRKLLGL